MEKKLIWVTIFLNVGCSRVKMEDEPDTFTISGSDDYYGLIDEAREACKVRGYPDTEIRNLPKFTGRGGSYEIEKFKCLTREEVEARELALKKQREQYEQMDRIAKENAEKQKASKEKERVKEIAAIKSLFDKCFEIKDKKLCMDLWDKLSHKDYQSEYVQMSLILCGYAGDAGNDRFCLKGLEIAQNNKNIDAIGKISAMICESSTFNAVHCVEAYKFSTGAKKSKYFAKAAESSFKECSATGSDSVCKQIVEISDCSYKTSLCNEVKSFTRRYAEIQFENAKNKELLELKAEKEKALADQENERRKADQERFNLQMERAQGHRERMDQIERDRQAWEKLGKQIGDSFKAPTYTAPTYTAPTYTAPTYTRPKNCSTNPNGYGGYNTTCY